MRVVSNARLVDFATGHRDAQAPLQAWRKLMESSNFAGYNELRKTFSSVDVVDDKYVFDIRGNHYRIIAYIHFEHQICFIKHVLTHAEYDKGRWK